MFSFFDAFTRKASESERFSHHTHDVPPWTVVVGDAPGFDLAKNVRWHEGYPIPDWEAAQAWLSGINPTELKGQAWTAVERAWLLHLRDTLGSHFQLNQSQEVFLLSSLENNVALATVDYMERTLKRVTKLLDGIAEVAPEGKDILLVFDDAESYYRYVSFYYPDNGEFAFSSGMHIRAGCSHYVTVKSDLRTIEPIIAHEMTHGCVGHLPLPVWLNEGLAVNIENRLVGSHLTHTPQQLLEKHQAFWGGKEIQEFWSGTSFLRTDDGSLLSYDLARLMVEHMAKDWGVFRTFVLAADSVDAGSAAAREYLGIALGTFVHALIDQDQLSVWEPDPASWS